MATIWMLSRIAGTTGGDRAVVSSVPDAVAEKVAREFQAEFTDMGLDVVVWAD